MPLNKETKPNQECSKNLKLSVIKLAQTSCLKVKSATIYSHTPTHTHIYVYGSKYGEKSDCFISAFGPGIHAISKWCTGRKWQIPIASHRKRSRGRIKADNMGQGEGPTSEWCTGREWPVNCMTVISAWWRSNMPCQRSSRRLSGRWTII